MSGIETFNRSFELDVGNTVREHRVQALLGQLCAVACVTEIMRYQVEALRLRGAVSGEVDHDGVFGFRALQSVEWSGFQRRWTSLTGEAFNCGKNVCFRCVLIE